MKKLFRILTSRYFFCAVVILLEFALLVAVYWYLCLSFRPVLFLAGLFAFGVFIYIINHYENPEFKLPWLVIVMALGVVGAFIFFILVGDDRMRRPSRKYHATAQRVRKFLPSSAAAQTDSLMRYLTDATGLPASDTSRATYYATGEDFYTALLKDLRRAQHFIFLEFFIVEPGEMWDTILALLRQKVAAGVEVYMMYDDLGCMTTLPQFYDRQLRAFGIHTIIANQVQPVLSRVYNNRDHRKIVVVDGKVSYTGGVNLADEYINVKKRLGYWKDSAVRLEGTAVQNLTALFLEFWNSQTPEPLPLEPYLAVEPRQFKGDGVILPYGDGPSRFYPEAIGKNVYLRLINTAERYCYITTPYLICDYELMDALCLAAKRGVDVRVIVPHTPDKRMVFWVTQLSCAVLVRAGVQVYEYTPGFIHAKNVIVDDKFATCGTINFDFRSLVHHFECGVLFHESRCIAPMKADFLAAIEGSLLLDTENSRLPMGKKLVAELLKFFSPLL